MRVISGQARGRKLKAPKGMKVRPTIDRVKEALFNIIGPAIVESNFLDLYAGTGSIAIEALSRGAALAVLVERDQQNIRLIKENLLLCGLAAQSIIYHRNVQEALLELGQQRRQFDFIFLDPPYGQGLVEPTLAGIMQARILADGGLVIAEHGRREEICEAVQGLALKRQSNYGDRYSRS